LERETGAKTDVPADPRHPQKDDQRKVVFAVFLTYGIENCLSES